MDLDPTQFPEHTRLQGLSAQAEQWFLQQIERCGLSLYDALYIVHRLQGCAIDLMRRELQNEDS
jgi:hypothetical protein